MIGVGRGYEDEEEEAKARLKGARHWAGGLGEASQAGGRRLTNDALGVAAAAEGWHDVRAVLARTMQVHLH